MGKRPNVTSRDITAEVREMIALTPDQRVVLDGRGGWKIAISFNAKGEVELEHFQPAPDGARKFFAYTTEGNPYGAGKIDQEPDLALPFGDLQLPLVGVLVLNKEGQVAERYSWSNLYFVQKRRFRLSDGNGIFISDPAPADPEQMVFKGWLRAVFTPDKNRLSGYVGIVDPLYQRVSNTQVKVLEMETLVLGSL